jgi:hypothetical protein
MPPQSNQVPPVPPVPPSPQPVGSGFQVDSLQKNPKFITTLKTFAIYGPILMVINFVVAIITSGFRYGFYAGIFAVPALIMAIISGVIGGLIGGAIFYFLYDPIHNWVKRSAFLSKYIHDMFTLFWIPSLVFLVIGAIFGLLGLMSLGAVAVGLAGVYGAASVGGAFIGVVISFVVNIAVYYWYSKTISSKLTPLYPW